MDQRNVALAGVRKLSDDELIYSQVLIALKASTACKQQRKDFAHCRATDVGRLGDPTFCDT